MKFYFLTIICKFYKWKIDNFFKKNKISFIVSHYNESFDYLKILPNNQKIYLYIKGKVKSKLPKKKNIKIISLPNYGREEHVYTYHIKKNYNKLTNINFFFIASFYDITQIQKFKRFSKVYKSISKDRNEKKNLYLSENDSILYKINYFKKWKIQKTINPYFTKVRHVSNKKRLNLKKAKKRPLIEWFKYYFPNKSLYHLSSMNGIFAVKKNNIKQIPRKTFVEINKEYNQRDVSYESGHYLERLYPSIFS